MKVFLESVGCRLNQAEIEQFAAKFRNLGYEITDDAQEADLAVINTCSVTAAAASDSRGKIRLAARSGKTRVVVTGCWSEMDPAEALSMPGVIRVVRNRDKDQLHKGSETDLDKSVREILPGAHYRTRAFIKVQDGCNNHCTFCITRLARGKARSVPFKELLADVNAAWNAGGKEIVLTGVNLGSWGIDFDQPSNLTSLIQGLLNETDFPRIRLSSLESWNLGEDFVRLWENPRMCPHLHLPLQSGSEAVLKKMARRTKLPDLLNLVQALRSINPDFGITTDVIVGFPGETKDDFELTLDFVSQAVFNAGHVFTFSARPETAAARMENNVIRKVKKERSKVLRSLFEAQHQAFCQRMTGKTVHVLWETAHLQDTGRWMMKGLSENYLIVQAESPENRYNQISPVTLMGFDGTRLTGEIAG